MCAQFTQRVPRLEDFLAAFKIIRPLLEPGELTIEREKILPYTKALTFVHVKEKTNVVQMNFSLIPAWSKERKLKFATHNARLESIDEKPSFREAFKKRHCIIPLSGFIEPIYEGKLAGNMVEFFPKKDSYLLAAGIWEEWVDKSSKNPGEIIQSFSIITSDPIDFVKQTGHDRSPVFLSEKDADTWLSLSEKNPAQLKLFLQKQSYEPDLDTKIDRALKSKK